MVTPFLKKRVAKDALKVVNSAERGDVAVEVAVIDEGFQPIDERVGSEKRLLEERIVVVASLGANVLQNVREVLGDGC